MFALVLQSRSTLLQAAQDLKLLRFSFLAALHSEDIYTHRMCTNTQCLPQPPPLK